jgi:hypothetical protein
MIKNLFSFLAISTLSSIAAAATSSGDLACSLCEPNVTPGVANSNGTFINMTAVVQQWGNCDYDAGEGCDSHLRCIFKVTRELTLGPYAIFFTTEESHWNHGSGGTGSQIGSTATRTFAATPGGFIRDVGKRWIYCATERQETVHVDHLLPTGAVETVSATLKLVCEPCTIIVE